MTTALGVITPDADAAVRYRRPANDYDAQPGHRPIGNPIIATIEQRRREIGMTRHQAAEHAGLYRATVQSITTQRMPRLFVIEALAGAVGLRLVVEPIEREPIRFVRRRR